MRPHPPPRPLHPRLLAELERIGLREARGPVPAALWQRLTEGLSRHFTAWDEEQRHFDHTIEQVYAELARLGASPALRAGAERNTLLTVLNSIADGLCVLDRSGCATLVNPAAVQLLGRPQEALGGRPLLPLLLGPGVEPPDYAGLLARGETWRDEEALFVRGDGERIPVAWSLTPILAGENGEPGGAVLVCRDVARQRELTRSLSHRAAHDPLTGLVNRSEFEQRVAQRIDDGRPHVLMFMDLDRFKQVNDGGGHAAGDALLRGLAIVLAAQIRGSDTLARLGGDEFAVLLDGCPAAHGERVAEKMLAAVRDFRLDWQGQQYAVGVSIGLAALDGRYPGTAEALAGADAACYAAKLAGRDCWRLHAPEATVAAAPVAGSDWGTRLRAAIHDRRLALYAQPIRPLTGGGAPAPADAELFLRLLDPELGELRPGAFLDAAERLQLAAALDRAALGIVLDTLATRPGDTHRYVLNLGSASLADDEYLPHLRARLAATGVAAGRLAFDVNARDALAGQPAIGTTMAGLRALGCRVLIDDVGLGLAAPAAWRTLQADGLKLDGALVRALPGGRIEQGFVAAIAALGRALALPVIAESVETAAQLAALQALGIGHGQGEVLGAPQRWA
ncbi:EAL domain-containing protein [Plasticicumulans sp.]|uniref:EAL domain-containing protein n=1 Tax=Plasticicumulans sp. TaxID=2307179 RepID=UPI0039399C9F|nr:EAL domain-containing protein [Pseudomonadota bacterium]